MKKFKISKYFLLTAIIFCMLPALTGCDGSAWRRSTTEESESITLSPAQGGSIGIFSYKPDTLCPIMSNVWANLQMLNLVFDSLIEVGDSMEAQPCLAESWYSSDGGRIWTISLRSGVNWHDGSPFSAEDVVFTVNQIVAAATSPFKTNVENIASITAEGAGTLKIELYNPSSSFINMLYFPVIKNSAEGINPSAYVPIGTGAFSFHDENEGNIYRLKRNNGWWGGKVYLSEIEVHLLPEKSAETYMFSSGEIDIATAETASEYKETSEEREHPNIKVMTYETSDYSFLGINHNNPTLQIQTVRQAISGAINRSDIVDNVLGGEGVAANAPINPSWSICDNDIDRFIEYSEQKAADLLSENGWNLLDGVYQKSENGTTYRLEFSLLVNTENAERTQIAETIAKSLSEFGIKINLVKKNYADYEAAVLGGNYDLFVGEYRITPDLRLSLILGEGNVFNFADDEFSALLNEINTAGQSQKKTLYGNLQNLFNEKMPIVGLFFEKSSIVTGPRIKGKPAPNMYNIYNGMENVYVETTASNNT